MKKTMLRKTAAILCAVLACAPVLSACGDTAKQPAQPKETQKVSPADEAQEAQNEDSFDNGRSGVKDTLPDDLDFEGTKMRVITRAGDAETKIEFYAEAEVGEVINDAVYARNRAVEERLNVEIVLNLRENLTQDYGGLDNMVEKAVAAGSDDFDLASTGVRGMTSSALQGNYLEMNQLEYLDFTQPWWNQAFFDITGYNGHNYLAMGELSLTMISSCYVVFFNRNMFYTFFPDDPTLYEAVDNGTWTLDKMITYCSELYQDLNGDGKPNEGDRFGNFFPSVDTLAADAYFGGCGVTVLRENAEGEMYYCAADETNVKFFNKMKTLLFENNNTLRAPEDAEKIMTNFLDGNAMFTAYYLSHVNYLRDMKEDYGIIPMPKLDEEQKDYITYFHDGASAFGIPMTCENSDIAAAFLEAMCAESYRVVTPAYFETALKTKYSRDEETSHMLDLIVGGIYTDVSSVFGDSLSNPLIRMRPLFASKSNCENAVSKLTKLEKIILKGWETIVESYEELEY